MSAPACRFCQHPLSHEFANLGMSPLSNAFLRADELDRMEPFYPLVAFVCERCFLVQLPEVQTPERLFSDYAYFSSYSDSWLEHVRRYCATMVERLGLGRGSQVVEIASNDGYLLQYFAALGIPVLGIEPAANVAEVARGHGIETLVRFFGVQTATELAAAGRHADLLLGNNVLAHVPDLNDFVEALRIVLKPAGVITMEFPHLLCLIAGNQFDTIYHEHFSYFSFTTVRCIFEAHGLTIFDVDRLPTHGGSLRIHAQRADAGTRAATRRVAALLEEERAFGVGKVDTYCRFGERARETRRDLLQFLIEAKAAGKRTAAYGAPAKGNTLLNYCGIRDDLVEYTVDRSPHKQGRYLPGTHLPIYAPDRIRETRPDYVLILPWNIKDEIMRQMADVREWGGRFVVPIPRVEVLS